MGQPEISASVRATTTKSASVWLSLAACSRPQNSFTSASAWFSPTKLLALGKSLSSRQTPATPRSPSLRTKRRTVLKLPWPVSPSTRMGTSTASTIYSSTSSTCVQDASFASRRPRLAETLRPEAQMAWKPASSAILAESPLCASIRKERSGELTSRRSAVVFGSALALEAATRSMIFILQPRSPAARLWGACACYMWAILAPQTKKRMCHTIAIEPSR